MNTGETRSYRNDPTPSAFAMRPGSLRDARLRRVLRTTPFGVFGKLGELYFFFSSPYIPDRSGMHGLEG